MLFSLQKKNGKYGVAALLLYYVRIGRKHAHFYICFIQ